MSVFLVFLTPTESSTPNSPEAKIDGQNMQKPIPDVQNGSGNNDSTSGGVTIDNRTSIIYGVTSSSKGDTQTNRRSGAADNGCCCCHSHPLPSSTAKRQWKQPSPTAIMVCTLGSLEVVCPV